MNLSFHVFFFSLLLAGDVLASGSDKFTSTRSGVYFYGRAADTIANILSANRKQWNGEKCQDARPSDCGELDKRVCPSGIYTIYPDKSSGFDVFCDMEKDGGGWTVFQRRQNGLVNFYRDWEAYKEGFGSLRGEFWLGNDHINKITSQEIYTLRVDLVDFKNNHKYAKYSKFSVGPLNSEYKLEVGGYSGNAGNDFGGHDGQKFSTKDKDNDVYSGNCAESYKGGWWYSSCHSSNLNGLYLRGNHTSFADGINWKTWTGYNYSLKATTMMIKRTKLF